MDAKVIKAIETIADFCDKTSCDRCELFSKEDDCCRLVTEGTAPFQWKYFTREDKRYE